MKQVFLLVLTLAATHAESEHADSSNACPDCPGIGCLLCTTIKLRPDCIAKCFSHPPPPPPPPPHSPPCSVNKADYFLCDGKDCPKTSLQYTCGDGSTRTRIFYPTEFHGPDQPDEYPVVMFHRGSSGYYSKHDVSGLGYDAWLESVAKQCLIVIAPETDGEYADTDASPDECKRDKDLLIAMNWFKAAKNWAKLNLSSSLKADWGRVGAMGHSAGAHHLPQFVEDAKDSVDIKATVFSHGGDDLYINPSNHSQGFKPYDKPSLFLTANADDSPGKHCTSPKCSHDLYKGMKATNKVFANMKIGDHNEPHDPKLHQFAAWTGRFLACHLYPPGSKRRNETCTRIYTKKGNPEICHDSSKFAPVSSKDGNGPGTHGCHVTGQGPPIRAP